MFAFVANKITIWFLQILTNPKNNNICYPEQEASPNKNANMAGALYVYCFTNVYLYISSYIYIYILYNTYIEGPHQQRAAIRAPLLPAIVCTVCIMLHFFAWLLRSARLVANNIINDRKMTTRTITTAATTPTPRLGSSRGFARAELS